MQNKNPADSGRRDFFVWIYAGSLRQVSRMI